MQILLLGTIIFLAHILEAITGFGCTVIALPFVSMILGIKLTVPVLAGLGLLMSSYIVCRSWRNIQFSEFLFIVIYVGIGMPLGMFLFKRMSPVGLSLLLACFMIGVGIHGTFKTVKDKRCGIGMQAAASGKKNIFMKFILFCGGIIHGAFGTGGPFVVIYASKAIPDKSVFRVTLSMLWCSLHLIRFIVWSIDGTIWNREIWWTLLWLIPFMAGGVLIGDLLHHKVSYYVFRLCLYVVLALAGFVMFGNNLCKIL